MVLAALIPLAENMLQYGNEEKTKNIHENMMLICQTTNKLNITGYKQTTSLAIYGVFVIASYIATDLWLHLSSIIKR